MNRKEFEKYVKDNFPPYLSSLTLERGFEKIYKLERGVLVLDENWQPEKPSTIRWIKNLLF